MSIELTAALASACLTATSLVTSPRDADALSACRDYLRCAQEALDDLSLTSGRVDIRYLSPCPPGFDTVLGWLAKRDPETLALMDHLEDISDSDDEACRERCEAMGLLSVPVDACPWLHRAFGVRVAEAFPIAVLKEAMAFGGA